MKKSEIETTRAKSTAVRGKYTNLLQQGTNVVILDADLIDRFPDSVSVNQALRAFLAINDQIEAISPRQRSHGKKPSATPRFDPRTGRIAKAASR
jgi:hypothetical protein